MKEVFIASDNILSPIGVTSADNFSKLTHSISGIQKQDNPALSDIPFFASLFNNQDFFSGNDGGRRYTKFEKLLISSINDALQRCNVEPADKKTVLIISSTKGNIGLLETGPYNEALKNRISLTTSSRMVADHFTFFNKPVVISNACISGLLAMITGMRMIQSGQYDHAVVAGADVISKFILSGFQSFQAVSNQLCKPFDAERTGINLGEGAGTIILSAKKTLSAGIKISGGSVSNDANHISGPSRTGEELKFAIMQAMKDAGVSAKDIDLISAHGTATIFNDEMEANAFTLANLQDVPVNSLKGYYGHTLGAAGIIESVITAHSMQESIILPTAGFQTSGVSKPVNVCKDLHHATLKNCLKTASGFGGCNAAIILRKE